MTTEPVAGSFGAVLQSFRKQAFDRRRRTILSQERLAEEISQLVGLQLSRNVVCNWENGNTLPKPQADRFILLAIVTVLHRYGGLQSRNAADQLLSSGDYRILNENEALGINPGWATSPKTDLPAHPLSPSYFDFGQVLKRFSRPKQVDPVELYPATCGDMPINLAQQRLLVSAAFGGYFTGLLERTNLYLELENQIDCPAPSNQAGLRPIQRIFWLLEYSRGPRILIIGGESGMGKSTLAAKIIRCLYQEQGIDLILGDSAKSEQVHPVTREILHHQRGYYNIESFYKCLCDQLGLPELPQPQVLSALKDRLVGQKAIIVVDNLESVDEQSQLLESLHKITSRDVRAIVTSRQVSGIKTLDNRQFVVQMQPLLDKISAASFISWHIDHYQHQHRALETLRENIPQNIAWLIERTGGIPLLIQLVLSDVARSSWEYIQTLPDLFGSELLDYLYKARWEDLARLNHPGLVAQQLLKWIAQEQYQGQTICTSHMQNWALEYGYESTLPEALTLLYERFLVLNRDPQKGNFSLYPSLVKFLGK